MASFAALILIGSVVLTLPGVTIDGGISYVDAAFTSTSAHAPSVPISFCGCALFPSNGDVNQGSFCEDWTRQAARLEKIFFARNHNASGPPARRVFDMRILLVEDDLKIASFILKGLEEAGFAVDHAADGEDGLHLALTEPYDVAIIDIMLPKVDGLTLIEELRHGGGNTPVLILSAKRSVDDRVKGLQTGGDDYLTKPFAFSELIARVQALIRRASSSAEPSHLTLGDLSMDLLKREVIRGGRKIDLQPREFALLEYLMRNAERVVSKTMILEHVWDYNFDPQTDVVEVLVCRLRSKIDRDFRSKMIHTMRGVGYVLKV